MKKSELVQIKGLNIKELKSKAKSLKDEIAGLIMDKNMKKLKDKKAVFKKRKDLAQVLTVIRQKELLSELEDKVQNDSENSENLNVRQSDNQTIRQSGTPSPSEFSEKSQHRIKRKVKS